MKIEFIPSTKEVELIVPPPRPAAYYVPDWYKKMPKFSESNVDIRKLSESGPGLKHCIPFLDSMVSGYIQETWTDIAVGFDKDGKTILATAPNNPEPFRTRDISSLPMGPDFYNVEFVWNVVWIPKMPKGWSLLFTTPFNHVGLPFQNASGIIDSDQFYHSPSGNYPFYVKKDFHGIIPAGTPMYQMIPFKREDWQSSPQKFNAVEQLKNNAKMRGKFLGAYRDFYHVKKFFS
jgi:hypothetical protein